MTNLFFVKGGPHSFSPLLPAVNVNKNGMGAVDGLVLRSFPNSIV